MQEEYYQKMVEYRNKHNKFAIENGIFIILIREGYAEVELEVQPHHLNPIGSVHGGCLFTLADACCISAATSYGMKVTTMDATFHFLRPGLNSTKLLAKGQVIKHGRQVNVVRADIYDQDEVLLATGTFSCMSLGKPLEFDF